MSNRLIKSTAKASSVELTKCFSSLLALELLFPSPEIYLISPWISDMPVLDNSFGQFRGVIGDLDKTKISLAKIIVRLAEIGSKIYIICRPNNENTDNFLKALQENPTIEIRKTDSLHEKGLITQHFHLHGSMNFTYFGLNFNDESIELKTDRIEVNQALLEARHRWGDLA
jgi:hypothetical protein